MTVTIKRSKYKEVGKLISLTPVNVVTIEYEGLTAVARNTTKYILLYANKDGEVIEEELSDYRTFDDINIV